MMRLSRGVLLLLLAEVGGVRVHHQEKGSGPALVLIHGDNSSAYTWKDVSTRWPRSGAAARVRAGAA